VQAASSAIAGRKVPKVFVFDRADAKDLTAPP